MMLYFTISVSKYWFRNSQVFEISFLPQILMNSSAMQELYLLIKAKLEIDKTRFAHSNQDALFIKIETIKTRKLVVSFMVEYCFIDFVYDAYCTMDGSKFNYILEKGRMMPNIVYIYMPFPNACPIRENQLQTFQLCVIILSLIL